MMLKTIFVKLLLVIYSFRTYGFSKKKTVFKLEDSANYENRQWGKLRAKEFGRLDLKVPSLLDYEKTRELIEKIQNGKNPRLKILDFGGGNLSLYNRISAAYPNVQFE